MFDFDVDGGWDVGKEADNLTKSLFGASKKKKKQGANKHSNLTSPGTIPSGILYDSDDETFTKKGVRKMKEKRRKQKKKVGGSEKDSLPTSPSDPTLERNVREVPLDKSDAQISLKNQGKSKNKKHQDTNVADNGTEPKKAGKRKRESSETGDGEPKKKSKKAKEDSTPGNSSTTATEEPGGKKRKRHRKKKNNSKKNKYAHLALNRQGNEKMETTESNGVDAEAKVPSPKVKKVESQPKPPLKVKKVESQPKPPPKVKKVESQPKPSPKVKKVESQPKPPPKVKKVEGQPKSDVSKQTKTADGKSLQTGAPGKKAPAHHNASGALKKGSEKTKGNGQISAVPSNNLMVADSPAVAKKNKKRKGDSQATPTPAAKKVKAVGNSNSVVTAPSQAEVRGESDQKKKSFDSSNRPKSNGDKGKTEGSSTSKPPVAKVSQTYDNKQMMELLQRQNKVLKALEKATQETADDSGDKKRKKKKKKQKSENSEELEENNRKKSKNSDDSFSDDGADDSTHDTLHSDSKSKTILGKHKNTLKTAPGKLQAQTPKRQDVKVTAASPSIWGDKAATLGGQAREKLNAARFRYLNEQLYTCEGSEALRLFREDRQAFKVYHTGFENQAAKWPVNPINVVTKQIKDKSPDLVVADFGCGDAKLAQALPQKVHSFDLVALNPRVTACDMSKVPLPSETVDIAVFCLSLMGTNLDDYVHEANRVLKNGGLLKIVEVVSRFKGLSTFLAAVCSHGFQLLNKRDLSQMFYLMDFRKVKSVKKVAATGKSLTLKPCIYKKR